MLIILLAIIIYLLLLLAGWGATTLLIPAVLRPYKIWLIPWMGILVLSITGLWLSRIGLGTALSIYIVIGFSCILLIIGETRKYGLGRRCTKLQKLDHLLIAIAAAFGLLLTLLPLFLSEQIPTTISLGNNDAHDYALIADFLKDHGIYQAPVNYSDSQPNAYSLTEGLRPGVRTGSWIFFSLIGSAVRLPTHQIFTITLAVIFSLTPALLYVFTYVVSGSRLAAAFSLIISVLNVNLLFITYHGFGGQVPAYGLLVLSFLLSFLLLQEKAESRLKKEDKFKYVILLGISVSGLFSMYVEIVPFLIIPMALALFWLMSSQSSKRREMVDYLALTIAITLATLFVDPFSPIEGWQRLLAASSADAGWIIPWAGSGEILGFLNVHRSSGYSASLSIFVGAVTAATVLLGATSVRYKAILCSSLTFATAILCYMRLVRVYEYGYFKAVTFNLFIFIVLFSIGLKELANVIATLLTKNQRFLKNQRYSLSLTKSVVNILMIFLTFLPVGPALSLGLQNYRDHIAVNENIVSLQEIDRMIDKDQAVYIPEGFSLWEQMWATKFLGDRTVLFASPSTYHGGDKFVSEAPPPDSLVLTLSSLSVSPLLSTNVAKTSNGVVWSNEKFSLQKRDAFFEDYPISMSAGKNWYNPEYLCTAENCSEFRWLGQDATLLAKKKLSSVKSIELFIDFITLRADVTVDIYVDDIFIEAVHLKDSKRHRILTPFTKDAIALRFHTVEGTFRPENDPRDIAVGVKAIEYIAK